MVAIELDTPVARRVVVSLPLELYCEALQLLAHCSGFVQLTRDAAEVTLIIDEIAWAKWAADFPGARASMAEVTRLMAGEGISLLAISSWRTDGLLVGENHFDRAVTILRGAKHLAALAGTE